MSLLDKLILLLIVIAIVAVWALWQFARYLFPSASRLRITVMLVVVVLATVLVIWATNAPQERPTVVHVLGDSADADAFQSRFPELTIVHVEDPPTLVTLEDFLEANEDPNGQDDFSISYVAVPSPPITASQELKRMRVEIEQTTEPARIALFRAMVPVFTIDMCLLEDEFLMVAIADLLTYSDWNFGSVEYPENPSSAWLLQPCGGDGN